MTDLPTLHRPTAWKWYPVQGDRLNLSILEWKYWQGLDTETILSEITQTFNKAFDFLLIIIIQFLEPI